MLYAHSSDARTFFGRTIQLPVQKIAPGSGQILIDFVLPKSHEFAKNAPSTIFIRTKHPDVLKTPQTAPEPLHPEKLPHVVTYLANPGKTIVSMDMRVYFCDEVSKICLFDFIRLKFPVQVQTGAPSKILLSIPLKSKTNA